MTPEAVAYMTEFHRVWEERFSRLDDLLEDGAVEGTKRRGRT